MFSFREGNIYGLASDLQLVLVEHTEISFIFQREYDIIILKWTFLKRRQVRPQGVLPIMDYTGTLPPKGVPFSGWRYI